jgi:hypothetical protein
VTALSSVEVGLRALAAIKAAAEAESGNDAVLDVRLALADLDGDEVLRVAAAVCEIAGRRLARPLARGRSLVAILDGLALEWRYADAEPAAVERDAAGAT